MTNNFKGLLYFPDKNTEIYNDKVESLLFGWLKKFLETSGDSILDRKVLQTEKEKNQMIDFLLKKTKELLDRVLSKNNYIFHRSSIKSIFVVCFFITYKTFTGIDYETLYRNEDQTCCCNLDMRCLSKAIPEKKDKENIKFFKQVEIDIMENFDWMPFKLTTA